MIKVLEKDVKAAILRLSRSFGKKGSLGIELAMEASMSEKIGDASQLHCSAVEHYVMLSDRWKEMFE